MEAPVQWICDCLRCELRDVTGEWVEKQARKHLGLETGRVRHVKMYALSRELPRETLERLAEKGLRDPVLSRVFVCAMPDIPDVASFVLVGKMPGVTDDEGLSAQLTLADLLGGAPVSGEQYVHSSDLYLVERALPEDALAALGREFLGNELIHEIRFGARDRLEPYCPEVRCEADTQVELVDLDLSDAELLALSRRRVLSLSLAELKAIRKHYETAGTRERLAAIGRGPQPTDCELEVLAQTWSEHCKHKEFNALIRFHDDDTGDAVSVDSLFKTCIKGATETIAQRLEAAGQHWLVKVFSDNAGLVALDQDELLAFKVETHNTPSALDPYGGAITGILGNNRDPLGTGRGGGRLLFNTNVLCFGPPDYGEKLLTGQLHPRRVFEGVRLGIEHGGNKSGIPTVNGAIVFDDRYAGKPLVFCGTGGIMPASYGDRASWEKEVNAGDCIVMAGGRVGKDGIHGATFSSVEIDRHSPRTAVQIGSPFTQKLLSDFLHVACERGLVSCCTDNGAGGLSSSVGELASICGGATVDLERVPLKYTGLKPWEIFVSESQERMTLVVRPEKMTQLLELARRLDVELSHIGDFNDSGLLEVRYGSLPVASLDMEFLHEGVPRKHMTARWSRAVPAPFLAPGNVDWTDALHRLLGSYDICSREAVIRQYDHEVKGKTVVKPLMGPKGKAPQDAAVMRLSHTHFRGIAISNGIAPHYGDIDPYRSSAAAFDEAVRQIVAVGGRLPDLAGRRPVVWSATDNFCMPDCEHDPVDNPDGELKLGKLVRMCQALYDMSLTYNIPMTSGKDSMKNDYRRDGTRISVPPTVLYSMVCGLDDVRRAVTTELKSAGDLVYVLGETHDELGASAFARLFGCKGGIVPEVRGEDAVALYRLVAEANEEGLIESCHDCSE
ncbi:MAG: phosphoribosylformylglycinamidine synthase, partial [Deltaproteobacteria bacterium]|nr:phosphoribosylformylglycinamidine synthase [Deltaproteobacteria bacterium]